jgi:hypothetical protein
MDPSPALELALRYHRNDRGERMIVPPNSFQEELLQTAWCESHCVQKSTQCGITEIELIIQFALCELGGVKCLWVDPTENERNKFQEDRIEHLKTTPYYSTRIGPANKSIWTYNGGWEQTNRETEDTEVNIEQGFGRSRIVWIGSNARSGFHGYPADVATVDEVDLCNQENLILLPRRLDNSRIKIIRLIGNPTIPNFGINAAFQKSDRRHWHIPCTGPAGLSLPGSPTALQHHWITPEWEKHVIDPETDKLLDPDWKPGWEPRLICSCGAPIDRRSPGAWVPMDRGPLGYQISKLFSTRTTLAELYERWLEALTDPSKMQAFVNQDLGLPYMAQASKIVVPEACIDPDRKSQSGHPGPTVMGLDPGNRIHYAILDPLSGERINLINAGWVHDEEGVHQLIKDYNVHLFMVDARPDITLIQNLRRRYPAFHPTNLPWMFRCEYLSHGSAREASEAQIWHTEKRIEILEKSEKQQVNRTLILDLVRQHVVDRIFSFPSDARSLADGELIDHLEGPVRVWLEDRNKLGGGRYVWLKGNKRDDLFHCLGYALMALTLWRGFPKR